MYYLTKDYKDSEFSSEGFEGFKEIIDCGAFEEMGFFDLHVESIMKHVGFLKLNAKHNGFPWTIDFVKEDGQWKICGQPFAPSGV